MTASFTRAQLLSRGAKGGATLLVAGGALAGFADAAPAAADPLPLGDLAYARLLVGTELLAADFYSQAVAASNTGKLVSSYLERAYLNEQEHYQSVAGIPSGAGAAPAVAADFVFSYPAGTFASQGAIVRFARQLEATMLGAYLGAVGGMQTDSFKAGLAEIAACEAQHSAYFTTALGGKAFDLSFPPPLTMEQTSNVLDAYTS